MIEDRTRRLLTFWHRRHSTGLSYSSITYTHVYGKTTSMPRKEGEIYYNKMRDRIKILVCSYLEVCVVNMFKD